MIAAAGKAASPEAKSIYDIGLNRAWRRRRGLPLKDWQRAVDAILDAFCARLAGEDALAAADAALLLSADQECRLCEGSGSRPADPEHFSFWTCDRCRGSGREPLSAEARREIAAKVVGAAVGRALAPERFSTIAKETT